MSAPVDRSERIVAIDVLRGVALLGILLLNILEFGLPEAAYDNPRAAGGADGADLATWALVYVLFEGKMRALFSMLFGASVIIFTSRAERTKSDAAADLYFRRTLWLLAIGVVHAYFLWMGDILYIYGVCGLFLYVFRRVGPRRLMVAAGLVLALLTAKRVVRAYQDSSLRAHAESSEARQRWAQRLNDWQPSANAVAEEVRTHHSGYLSLFASRASNVAENESVFTYQWGFWDATAMMFLGMALFKIGFLSAGRTSREYWITALVGYGIGLAVGGYSSYALIHTGFDRITADFVKILYDVSRIGVAIGHICLVMLICKAGKVSWVTARLAAIGQMALTSYLSQTIICTVLFDAFGLFGRLHRLQLYGVVAAIWVFQFAVSKLWFTRYRFGPVEWLWRSLTYGTRPPMRIAGRPNAAAAHN